MRVKGGVTTRRRHKKVLKRTKGYRDGRKNQYRVAKQALMKADSYAFVSRKIRKRDFRSLWITRLNAALQPFEIQYSRFIYAASRKRVLINRKMLSELAITEPKAFEEVVKFVKA
ncbi:50S ribosomal protein L20 [Candidatus Peregrinibacteria bacterium CG11_big_fil_rev_8_21_14_0_20_46_8]|nr:MAG: 50S ribosomal protein L20 [Candidatus Peregrinibacteria bacterium CG11_big_fil_rev_8_21_14_0_20_46_8]